ncbi:tRNA dihydrouridine synthase DusB [Vallitalea pronyensis]|uniref:tRNA-dihydrouridine synthase n=1 Tax=Vallitalea pronyensis TaxID=1348613 RepID=A0A8J8MH59_9FIRM|nr:tRNA dihydrouridine synthase DusB [Vallitalea pronyensis]QUI21560.1 tRNA dihydrouridine synthase DusB [Vallitalea pronyensis]
MKIGNVQLENNVCLAPMAGVTDLPYRLLCKEQGCGLVYTEMISAKAVYFNNKNTNLLMQIDEKERPVAMQLFGCDPDLMAEMAKKIVDEHSQIDIIDINMGCPVPKVVNNGEGSGLMKQPGLVGEIVKKVSRAIPIPLTIKIRKGFDDNLINAVEIAKIAEANGAAAVGVHGRTREQYYSGKADWDIIRQVKEAITIPVLGNGDVFTPEDAKAMLHETGCDGILIGRGAQGNPWLFKRIIHYLESGDLLPLPTLQEIVEMIQRHMAMLCAYKGEYTAIREMRKHISWYTKGLPGSANLRRSINQLECFEAIEDKLEELKNMT